MLPAKKRIGRRHGKSRKYDAERKLLHEQEMRKKREDLMLTFMKDKVSREARSSSLNSIKLNWKWRCLLREAKHQELQAETNYLRSKFNHVVQTKDRIIEALTLALNCSDDQHNTSSETHTKQLDILIDIQNEHLERMQGCYEKQKAHMVGVLTAEMKNGREEHNSRVKHLSDLEASLEKELCSLKTSLGSDFQNRRDELLNKSIEEQHALRMRLNTNIADLWQQLQFLVGNYQQNTDLKKKLFSQIKSKDEKNKMEIAEQERKLDKIMTTLSFEKQKMNRLLHSGRHTFQQCHTQWEQLNSTFLTMKGAAEQTRDEANRRLTILTVASSAVIQRLEFLLDRANQVLKLSVVCEKNRSAMCTSRSPIQVMKVDCSDDDIVSAPMEQFWNHFNGMYAETLVLREEEKALRHQNGKLRKLLKEYFDRIAIPSESTVQEDVVSAQTTKVSRLKYLSQTAPDLQLPNSWRRSRLPQSNIHNSNWQSKESKGKPSCVVPAV